MFRPITLRSCQLSIKQAHCEWLGWEEWSSYVLLQWEKEVRSCRFLAWLWDFFLEHEVMSFESQPGIFGRPWTSKSAKWQILRRKMRGQSHSNSLFQTLATWRTTAWWTGFSMWGRFRKSFASVCVFCMSGSYFITFHCAISPFFSKFPRFGKPISNNHKKHLCGHVRSIFFWISVLIWVRL